CHVYKILKLIITLLFLIQGQFQYTLIKRNCNVCYQKQTQLSSTFYYNLNNYYFPFAPAVPAISSATFLGTSAYLANSITDEPLPLVIERNSVVKPNNSASGTSAPTICRFPFASVFRI